MARYSEGPRDQIDAAAHGLAQDFCRHGGRCGGGTLGDGRRWPRGSRRDPPRRLGPTPR